VEITDVRIARKPSHGVAGANPGVVDHGFAYMPSAGFVGKDEFVVTVEMKGSGHGSGGGFMPLKNGAADIHGKMDIDVSVDVTSK